VTRVRPGLTVESGLGSWAMEGGGGGQTSVPKQKRPNRFRVASRPMSNKERENFLEGKNGCG
jgi:hypothetical protein